VVFNHPLKSDNRPLYDQAIEALRKFIDLGAYKQGDKLPGESELARQLGISRPTLREALGNLEAFGLIERRHGVGTFVAAPAQGPIRGGLEQLVSLRSLAASAGIRTDCVDWEVDMVAASNDVAARLNLQPEVRIVHVQMTAISSEEGYYIAYMESFIPEPYVNMTDLIAYRKGSMLNYLLEKGDLQLSYTHTDLSCAAADQRLAQLLKVPEGKPLQLLAETYYSRDGRPIMQEYNYFITDWMKFHIIRRVARW
jgi:GntR family transcriptional regulator